MSDKKNNDAELRVGELTAREEFGRGIVRIDSNTMQKIGIKEGDIVEIEGTRKAGALAIRAYPSDAGINVIRMDGLLRRNAEIGVGDIVKVRKADVQEAKQVTLAPAQRNVFVQIHPSLIKQNIYMRPVSQGDIIVPSPVVRRTDPTPTIFQEFFGFDFEEFFYPTGETRFVVTSTNPKGIVRITDMTELEILSQLPKTFELEKRKVPTVTYEDVGGIHQAIQKVREMIELPLRHPELFSRLGIEPPKGVLLYGPPGTGKTLLARAVANEAGANFYSISGPEIFSKWYGQSLPYNENILVLNDGLLNIKPIGEVVNSKEATYTVAFNGNGKVKFSKINDFIQHPLRTEILQVKTKTGRKILVTNDHSVFTITNGKIADVKVSELVPSKSFIAIPSRIPLPNIIDKINILDFVKENSFGIRVRHPSDFVKKAKEILGVKKVATILGVKPKYVYDIIDKEVSLPVDKFLRLMKEADVPYNLDKIVLSTHHDAGSLPSIIDLDPNLCRLIGVWMAEGDYTKNGIRIHSTLKEVEELVKKVSKKFGHTYTKDGLSIHINSKALKIFFKNILGLGSGAIKKTIPPLIFALKKELLIEFIKGYYTGDGTIYLNQRRIPTIEATTYSEKLANDLMYLLLHFEIAASEYDNQVGNNRRYRVCFRGAKNLERFKNIGFMDQKRNKMISEYLKRIKWDRSDQIPIWDELRKFLKEHLREWVNSSTVGKDKLRGILENVDPLKKIYPDIWKIVESEIYWDKVTEIEKVKYSGNVYDISVNPSENFIGGFGGIFAHNTEQNLRKIFEEAEKNAPSIIFIDEIDAIAPKREEVTGEVEKRTVSQLLTLMDGLKKRGKVIVIAATNREVALDPALRRAGRFDREIELGVPDKKGRKEILQIHTRKMPLDKSVNLDELANITYGYVGADLEALAKEAAMHALRRLLPKIKWKEEEELPQEALEKLVVNKKDFLEALKIVEPSAMREVLIEIPNVKWNDIGGLEEVKRELRESVEWPLTIPESFERVGIQPPRGVLLYGPPGCGKTLLAKAIANESNSNFISVKGPELLSKWVGESEKRMRDLFRRAKQVAPSIIFFDEIDALAPKRGTYAGGEHVSERIVSQLLTEMSGLEELKDVVVIAATNRPDMLDPALLRPGRFDRQILVPSPDEKSRLKILEIKTKDMPLKGVDLNKLAKETEGYSGADLEALAREAGMYALRENKKANEVNMNHFKKAISVVKPTLDKQVLSFYSQFDERFRKKIMEEAAKEEKLSYVG